MRALLTGGPYLIAMAELLLSKIHLANKLEEGSTGRLLGMLHFQAILPIRQIHTLALAQLLLIQQALLIRSHNRILLPLTLLIKILLGKRMS